VRRDKVSLAYAFLLAVFMIIGCQSKYVPPVEQTGSTPIRTYSPVQESQTPQTSQTSQTPTNSSDQDNDFIIIKGEEYNISLTSLEIGDYASRPLSDADIEPLCHMVNLTSLSLVGNRITDISPLANLTNLYSLSL